MAKETNNDNKALNNELFTLTDETGTEYSFDLLARCDLDGNTYYAMAPADSEQDPDSPLEYVILRSEIDDAGEESLATIEDDDEFNKVEAVFNEEFSNISYDDDK